MTLPDPDRTALSVAEFGALAGGIRALNARGVGAYGGAERLAAAAKKEKTWER